jgi:hypothetical protein
MLRRLSLVLLLSIAASACTASPAPQTDPSAVPDQAAQAQATPELAVPDGWTAFRDDAHGYALAYPPTAAQPTASGEAAFSLTLPADPSTNVVEETIAVRLVPPGQPCTSPLAYGFAPEELAAATVELGGLSWLRQTRSGVAAGTASTWVAFSTSRGDRCVSLDYTLRTYDPANLDPTRFPTPPIRVEWSERESTFEQLVGTFVWVEGG